MSEETKRFSRALAADTILPSRPVQSRATSTAFAGSCEEAVRPLLRRRPRAASRSRTSATSAGVSSTIVQ